MADFTKYSNYKENTSYSSIIFGANSPVLEVELNELQQLLNTKMNRLIKAILGTGSFTTLSENSIAFNSSTKTLTFTDCIAIADNGWVAYVTGGSLKLNTSSSYIYVQLQEVTKTGSDTLNAYGNTLGSKVTNTMIDSRNAVETSRRKVITFTLKAGNTVPTDTEDTKNIVIGSWNGSTFTRSVSNRVEKLENQLGGLTLGVENGVLFIEAPDEEV